MELNEFKAELKSALERNSIVGLYDEAGAEKLFELTRIMLKVNESMNLTAITDEKSVILKHYVDSLTVSAYIPEGARVIDVGCGAGLFLTKTSSSSNIDSYSVFISHILNIVIKNPRHYFFHIKIVNKFLFVFFGISSTTNPNINRTLN